MTKPYPSLPLARRACLSEVQVLGGLADELFERIIRRALEVTPAPPVEEEPPKE